jgi:hypothetical protein
MPVKSTGAAGSTSQLNYLKGFRMAKDNGELAIRQLWVSANSLLQELDDETTMSPASWKHIRDLEEAVEASKNVILGQD